MLEFLQGEPVDARVRAVVIVQQHARTPTLSSAGRFFIDGILGLANRSISIRRSISLVMQCLDAILLAAGRTGFWKSPYGCLIGSLVPPVTRPIRQM